MKQKHKRRLLWALAILKSNPKVQLTQLKGTACWFTSLYNIQRALNPKIDFELSDFLLGNHESWKNILKSAGFKLGN